MTDRRRHWKAARARSEAHRFQAAARQTWLVSAHRRAQWRPSGRVGKWLPNGTRSTGVYAVEHARNGLKVDAAHRGKGLSPRLVAELLRGQKSQLFATTDDRFIKRTLSTAGFVEKGREWRGRRGQLSLWVLEPS